jgi:hypothetical protein
VLWPMQAVVLTHSLAPLFYAGKHRDSDDSDEDDEDDGGVVDRSVLRNSLALPGELEEGVYAGKVVKRRDQHGSDSESGDVDDNDDEDGSEDGSEEDDDSGSGDDDDDDDDDDSNTGSGSSDSDGVDDDAEEDDEVGRQLAALADEDESSALQLRKQAVDDVQPIHTRNQMVRGSPVHVVCGSEGHYGMSYHAMIPVTHIILCWGVSQTLWDACLEMRIMEQRMLALGNQLPQVRTVTVLQMECTRYSSDYCTATLVLVCACACASARACAGVHRA